MEKAAEQASQEAEKKADKGTARLEKRRSEQEDAGHNLPWQAQGENAAAKCMAKDLASAGVRVNTVNPDAVLRGSKIWAGEWRQQRAASNKVSEDDLDEAQFVAWVKQAAASPGWVP